MDLLWLVSGHDKAYLVPEGQMLFVAPGQLHSCAGEWGKAIPDAQSLQSLTPQCQCVVLVAGERLFSEELLGALPIELTTLVMITTKTSPSLREQFAQLDVDGYIADNMEAIDFFAIVSKCVQDKQNLNSLQQELTNYSSIAFTAMSSASEMGVVALFAEKAQNTQSLAHLARLLLSCARDLGLNGVVQFSFEQDIKRFPDDISPSLQRLLVDALHSDSRIISLDRFMLFNFDLVQLLVTDAPIGEVERYGRLRDVLAQIVSIAEARARTLKVNAMLKAQQDNTRLVMSLLEMASRDNRQAVKEIMTDLSISLRTMAMGMDLTLAQESELLGLADKALNSLENLQIATLAVEEHFRSLVKQLDDAAQLLDTPAENLEEVAENNLKIELF